MKSYFTIPLIYLLCTTLLFACSTSQESYSSGEEITIKGISMETDAEVKQEQDERKRSKFEAAHQSGIH